MFISGKVCDSSFMSPHSVTARDRATTWDVWEESNLAKTQAFTIANTEGRVCFCTSNMQQGNYKSAILWLWATAEDVTKISLAFAHSFTGSDREVSCYHPD